MKKLLLLLIVISFSIKAKAQVVFCPPGAEWNYSFYQFFSPILTNEKIRYTGDSLVNNELVKKLDHLRFFIGANSTAYNTLTFIKQRGDTVFMKNPRTYNQWQVLYNFACTPGQGWGNTIDDGWSVPVHNYISVDSIDHVTVNGFLLKRLFVTYNNDVNGAWGSGYPAQIIERFGCTKFMFNYPNHSLSMDDDFIKDFICYKDHAFGFKEFSDLPCDYKVQVGVSEERFENDKLVMFPNPVSGFLNVEISGTNAKDFELSVSDLQGRELRRLTMDEKDEIDLRNLSSGLYLISVRKGKDLIYKEKLIKE